MHRVKTVSISSEHMLHGSTGPVLNFGKEKVVAISTKSWRVMYPCVRTQRYDYTWTLPALLVAGGLTTPGPPRNRAKAPIRPVLPCNICSLVLAIGHILLSTE